MRSHWAFVLLGQNNTGKSTLQRNLVNQLCGKHFKKLHSNRVHKITHPQLSTVVGDMFVMGRSIQEQARFSCVRDYFERGGYQPADICILSSHSGSDNLSDVADFIKELRRDVFNVAGVFFENNTYEDLRNLSELAWDERIWLSNNHIANVRGPDDAKLKVRLQSISNRFQDFLIRRSAIW